MRPTLSLVALAAGLLLAAPGVAAAGARRALRDAAAALEAGDADALEVALGEVVAEDGRTAAKGLLELALRFPAGESPTLYWQVLGGLAALEDRRALDAVGDWLEEAGEEPGQAAVARDVLYALQDCRAPDVIDEVYEPLLDARDHPLALMAVDRLGELERPEAVDLLLEAFEDAEGSGSALERRLRATLAGLFGEDMGACVNFAGWWDQHRDTLFAGGGAEGGATGTVKDELDAARAGGLASATRRGKVLVLQGMVRNFDRIEEMLGRLDVPHEVMLKRAFMGDVDGALDGVAALILNCNFFSGVCTCPTCKPGTDPNSRLPVCTGCDEHQVESDRLSDEAIARIRRFVREGGSVFTEDWGLRELTARAWPERVAIGPQLAEGEVDYAPVPGQAGSPLLRGVLSRRGAGAGSSVARLETAWKVDALSPAVRVVDPEQVTVLLASEELARDVAADCAAVALTFSPGAEAAPAASGRRRPRTGGRRGRGGSATPPGGVVLHVLSHFGKQGSRQDEFTLQNLLVNFLLEAQDRWGQRR